MKSIRGTLLVGLLGAVLIAGTVASLLSYFSVRTEIGNLFDTHLASVAHTLQQQSDLAFQESAGAFTEPEEDDLVIEVFASDGRLLSTSASQFALPRLTEAGFHTIQWNDSTWRVYVLPDPGRTVLIAQPVSSRNEMRAEIAFRNLWPILALIPVLALLIWLTVGRALLPLRAIARTLDTRNPSAMAPLQAAGLPREVKPLVAALNDLLGRLSRALQTQRDFIADAAHELRTPLTAVDLQAQLAERASSSKERIVAIAHLRSGLKRASRLIEQLLTMARAEREIAPYSALPVGLNVLADAVVQELGPMAQTRNLAVRLARNDPTQLQGDPDGLRIVIGNLLDNAIRYSQPGGTVEVSVWGTDRSAYLEVLDCGEGIPFEERERVFDRFYRRPGTKSEGSGLGLAIVKAIAGRHHATVTFGTGGSGTGLRVTVEFPLLFSSAGQPS
jgi:two-component system, OmpR family, sensor kinase